ncbi:hypothetical protein ACPOL_3994 [Acidisarcina polymorpha]|uniref:Uncharacterized protein n=1 Tax=Acidisarcina polymorpha TaxID=2211140 RepID=A0A2Z5G269_9BACT|nr:hypothetical protein ACPOL_3994 [Acidisarcina polymorpha]
MAMKALFQLSRSSQGTPTFRSQPLLRENAQMITSYALYESC